MPKSKAVAALSIAPLLFALSAPAHAAEGRELVSLANLPVGPNIAILPMSLT